MKAMSSVFPKTIHLANGPVHTANEARRVIQRHADFTTDTDAFALCRRLQNARSEPEMAKACRAFARWATSQGLTLPYAQAS